MSNAESWTRAARRAGRRGFTLIELLVVLGVIAILITLSITVGREVTKGGEERLTRDMIRALDVTLTSWYGEKDSKFPAYLEADTFGGQNQGRDSRVAIIDGHGSAAPGDAGTSAEPTLGMFLLIAKETASVDSTLKQQIDSKYLSASALVTTYNESYRYEGMGFAPTVHDTWGNPIRFVHPVWHGGYGPFMPATGTAPEPRPERKVPSLDGLMEINYSRSYRTTSGSGSADEGICPGNRPYFYSCGPDGDPGTREDNVYGVAPSFPAETAKLK